MAPQRLVVDADPFGHAGPRVGHEDIEISNQAVHDLASTRHAQVHDDPALAPAQGVEDLALARRELPQPAPPLAPRRLQLDHLRAKVRKRSRRIRPGNDLPKFKHANAIKRTRHIASDHHSGAA